VVKHGTQTVTYGATDHVPTLFSLKAKDDHKLVRGLKLAELTVDKVIKRLKTKMS